MKMSLTARVFLQVSTSILMLVPVVIGICVGALISPFVYGIICGIKIGEGWIDGTSDQLQTLRNKLEAGETP